MRSTTTNAALVFVGVLAVVLVVAAVAPLVTGGSSGSDGAPAVGSVESEQYSPDRYSFEDDPGEATVEMDSRASNRTVLLHVGARTTQRDIRPLVNVLTENGHDVNIVGDRAASGGGFPGQPPTQPGFGGGEVDIAGNLESADAFVSVGATTYRPEQVEAIEQFAADGGRVLLLTEPRQLFSPNADTADLQSALGVYTEAGYVYNLAENDRNYQRVFVEPDGSGALTEGVDRAVFEGATPVRSASDTRLLSVIDGTQLSTTRDQTDAPVLVRADNVVLGGDTDFIDPENTLRADNDALVGNLADFLVTGESPAENGQSGNETGDGEVRTVTVAPDGEAVFEPQVVEIEPGTTVRFEWDSGGYNVNVLTQPAGGDWEGVPEVQSEGFVHEHTFETEGVYEFVSEPQRDQRMFGAVVVGDPPSSGP